MVGCLTGGQSQEMMGLVLEGSYPHAEHPLKTIILLDIIFLTPDTWINTIKI